MVVDEAPVPAHDITGSRQFWFTTKVKTCPMSCTTALASGLHLHCLLHSIALIENVENVSTMCTDGPEDGKIAP